MIKNFQVYVCTSVGIISCFNCHLPPISSRMIQLTTTHLFYDNHKLCFMYKSFPLRKMQGMNATWNRYLRHSNYESKILPGFLCSRVESLAETLSVTPLVSLPRREKVQIFTVKQRSKDSNLHCSLSRFRTKMGRKPVAYLNNCDGEAPFPSCPAHTHKNEAYESNQCSQRGGLGNGLSMKVTQVI